MKLPQDSLPYMSEVEIPDQPPEKAGGRLEPLRLRALEAEAGEPRHLATFIRQRPALFSLLALIAYALVLTVGGLIPALTNVQALGGYAGPLASLIDHSVSASFALALLCWLGWGRVAGLTPVREWRQLPLFWLPILYLGIVWWLNAPSFDFSDPIFTLIGVSDGLLTGLAEEILFRGVVLYALLWVWWRSPKGILVGAVLSSLLFSATHLLNLLANPLPLTLTQVMYTFFYGIFFAALLLRTNQLWLVILLHGLIDVISGGLSKPAPTPSTPLPPATPTEVVTALIFYLILTAPLGIYGWYLIRRSR